MSRRRRAIVLLGLALVLGGLAAADVARREAALRDQVGPLVDVVVARADLAAGRAVAAQDLAGKRVPARDAPAGAATLPETLIGRKLAAPVPRDGYVGDALIETEPDVVAPAVEKGERAAEVVALGAPDLIVPGARVDVLVTRDGEDGTAAATELALEDVEVLAARRAGAREDGGKRVAAALRVSVPHAVYLAAAQSFARELRLLPRAAGDRVKWGALRVGRALR